jgi:hypothetical protein
MYGILASSRSKTVLQQLGLEDRLEYLDVYLAASSLVADAPASKINKQMQTEWDGTHVSSNKLTSSTIKRAAAAGNENFQIELGMLEVRAMYRDRGADAVPHQQRP